MTISDQKILEKCREIELLCRDIYTHFAEIFVGDRDVVALWRKTAVEEQNHADQITLVLKLRKGLSCHVDVDPSQIDFKISQMQGYLETVKISPPTLKEAMALAIKLERKISSFHLDEIMVFEDESIKKLFSAMMASDQKHLESLEAAYKKLEG